MTQEKEARGHEVQAGGLEEIQGMLHQTAWGGHVDVKGTPPFFARGHGGIYSTQALGSTQPGQIVQNRSLGIM